MTMLRISIEVYLLSNGMAMRMSIPVVADWTGILRQVGRMVKTRVIIYPYIGPIALEKETDNSVILLSGASGGRAVIIGQYYGLGNYR